MTMDANTPLALRIKTAAFCAVALATASAPAALLYEPSSYAAQESLVLHLDGIRNAGVLKAHDNAAASWADLASPSGRKANAGVVAPAPATSLADGTSGWTHDGYYFNGMSFFQMSGALTLGSTYTIQVVCDVDTDKFQTRFTQSAGLVSEGNLQWPCFVGTTDSDGKDHCNIYYNCGNGQQRVNTKVNNTNFDVFVNKSGWNNHYLTAWSSGSQVSLFAGDSVGTKTSKNLSAGTCTLTFGASRGSTTYGYWRRTLVGTIKAVRIYDKALSDAELQQNRAIDEIRFFGALPVTNAIVATATAGLEGNEAPGAYAFDANGHTFSAPQQAALGAVVYSCAGYTLETWNGSAWSAPVAYGGTSCTLSDTSAKIRLTWQWEEAEFVPADYTWMASPANAQWDVASPNWNSGEVWADGNNAIFGASSETTVAVGAPRLVHDLTLNDVAYTFNGAGPLSIAGTITAVGAKNQNFDVPLASGRADGSLRFYATGVDWRSVYLNSAANAQSNTVLGGTVFLMPKSDGALGVVPAAPAENIFITNTPTIYGNASFAVHSNRIVRIASGSALWTGSNYPFTYRSPIVAEPDEGSDYSEDTYVKIRSNWGGLITFDPGEGRTNAFGRLFIDMRRLRLASGATCVTGPATETKEKAILYVKGTGTGAFSVDRGYLLVDGGELTSPKMAADRYVEVSSNGWVVVQNGGKVNMPEGVQWINGLNGPGKLTVADGGVFTVNQLRVSQSGGGLSEVHLDEGGLIAVHQLRMDNASAGLFAFDGGCLQATKENRAFFAGAAASWANVAFTVGEKGAGFDLSNGVNLWWGKPLASGAAADGGLFKKGAGILVLQSANAYNGPTVIEGGRIQARVDHALPDGTVLRLGGGADTRFTASTYDSETPRRDTAQIIGRIEGSGELDDMGASSVTNAIAPFADGVITFMTECRLSGDYEVSANATANSLLVLKGANQDISGLSVKIMNPLALDTNAPKGKYKILDAPNGYTGQFSQAADFPKDRWRVKHAPDAAYLVPVKAFLLIVR